MEISFSPRCAIFNAHLQRNVSRVFFNCFKPGPASGDFEDFSQLLQRIIGYLPETALTFDLVLRTQPFHNSYPVSLLPVPNRPEFRMQIGSDIFEVQTVPVIQNPFADGSLDRQLLSPLFLLNEIPRLLSQGAKGNNDQARSISSRTASLA